MKKFMSLLLAFIMLFMFMVCGSSVPAYADDRDDAAGVWKLVEITGDKDVMSKEDVREYEALGVVMYIKLRDNGTVRFSLFEDEMEGTWNEYGMVLDYAWLSYTVEDDVLTIENQDGGEMIFKRSSMDEVYSILGYKKDVLDESIDYPDKTEKIMDTDTASVKITGYKADMTGFTVYLHCRNKTKQEIVIAVDKCALNKYIFDPEWSVSLDRRETLDTEMTISPEEIGRCGLSSVDEMILELRAVNGVNDKVIEKGILSTVCPTGKKAADVRVPRRTPVDGEYAVLNNKACAFLIQGVDAGDARGYAVNCYLENRSENTLTFKWSGVTINGSQVTPVYEEAVLSGTLGYSDVIFMNSGLQEQGINTEEIKEIKGRIQVYDNAKNTPELIIDKEFSYVP